MGPQYLMYSTLEYVQRFATKEAADAANGGGDDDDDDEEMSDIGSIGGDEEVTGHMEV